ncbi:unnamed protein product [Alternaria alternata]
MKLALVLAIAAATHSVTAETIKTPSPSTRVFNSNVSGTSPALINRNPNEERPTVAFWDDDHATEVDWKKSAAKGGALMCALEGSDQVAGRQIRDTREPPSAASRYNSDLKTELHDWYWRETNPSTFSCSFSEHWHLAHAMRSLGLDGKPASEGGDNQCYRIEHWNPENRDDKGNQIPAINQWYSVPGHDKQYRATKAHFEFGINTKGGAIYGLFLESALASAKSIWGGGTKEPNRDDLPQLRAFSDIMWAFWVRNNPNVRNIRYFFMIGISNDLTNQIIASCLRDAGAELSEWPGTSFSTTTDQGHALLGSPNGATFAYLLMQHKAQLGQKTITKITVFRPETDDDLSFVDASLCFHVADGPQPPPDDAAMAATDEAGARSAELTIDKALKDEVDYAFDLCQEDETPEYGAMRDVFSILQAIKVLALGIGTLVLNTIAMELTGFLAALAVFLPIVYGAPTTAANSLHPEILAAMKRDLGLDAEQAHVRVARELKATEVIEQLRTKAGSSFGGAWLVDGELKVAVTDEALTSDVTTAGATALVVDTPLSKLQDAQKALDNLDIESALGKRSEAATGIASYYVDIAANKLILEALADSTAQAEELAKQVGLTESEFEVKTVEALPTTFVTVNGGDAYYINRAGRCSVGFSVTGGFVSAGHCGSVGNTATTSSGTTIGTFAGSVFPGSGDYSYIRGTTGNTYAGRVNNYNGGTIAISGSTAGATGSSVCRSGSTTGVYCGTVRALGATVSYAEGRVTGLTQTNVCAEPGDSGGSWYSGSQAQGVTSGGSGNCQSGGTTYFQPVNEILSAYGLTLARG